MAGIPFVPGEAGTGNGGPGAGGADAEPWRPEPWDGKAPPRFRRVAAFGGIYSNHLALGAAIRDARERGADAIVCLGDLGAFGPSPDRTAEILRSGRIPVVRGNYDDSIARGLEDCQCGYTDPRDNHYARLSYEYTLANTSPGHRRWMAGFPSSLRFVLGAEDGPGRLEVLAFHGSPRRMNEFLWETTTPTHFLRGMAREHGARVLLGTHTGIHWSRELGEGHWYVNAGALGRPANDGRTEVWYALLEEREGALRHEFVPVSYDADALADEMRDERLPEEFIETIRTGWWTTCLEVLPGKERARGRW
jgi:predicted phosphodiesterase